MTDMILPAVTQSIGLFSTFLPSPADVRKADPNDEEMINDVRMGELIASGLVLTIGAIASSITDSNVPISVSAIAVVILIFIYESILRSRPKEKVNNG